MNIEQAPGRTPDQAATGGALATGRLAGREAFAQAVRDAFAQAAHEGWNHIILSDANFEDWPLRERVVVESLNTWAKTGRHMTLLAHNYDSLVRNQPRFVTWRKTWSHIIECRQCKTADPLDFPSAIWSPGWVLQRLDLVRSTAVAGFEPERRVVLRELLDERLRASSPGFAAVTLGL